MLTERQIRLIEKCKKSGYGWKAFAEAVEKQGWCSHKQEEKLVEMWQKIGHAEAAKSGNIKQDHNYCYDTCISDSEAYISGDYY